jgi:organic radical activating enzyme
MPDFPVKSPTACQWKWTWSTIMLNRGTTSSCHRVNQQKLTLENFQDFHNLPKKIDDRQKMLAGERPTGGCEYCWRIEDAGGFSDRMAHLAMDRVPAELEVDPTATAVIPRILEIYFNNVCNLSCLYCGPWFSTVWENEFKKHGEIKKDNLDLEMYSSWRMNPRYDEMVKKLWEWMELNSSHLREFHILGGEPFFQPEFLKCLDHFEKYPNPHCEIVIITNLMVDDSRIDYYIQRLKKMIAARKLKGLQITASLDCWGPQQEYIRSGLDLAQWQRNFEKLLEHKWIRLQINQAISVLSIKTTADLMKKIQEWNKQRKIYNQFMTVETPSFLKPDIFDPVFFKDDFQEIIDNMPLDNDFDHNLRKYMQGISLQIESTGANISEMKKLKLFLEEMDRRRSKDYKKLFPWLVQQFERYQI